MGYAKFIDGKLVKLKLLIVIYICESTNHMANHRVCPIIPKDNLFYLLGSEM